MDKVDVDRPKLHGTRHDSTELKYSNVWPNLQKKNIISLRSLTYTRSYSLLLATLLLSSLISHSVSAPTTSMIPGSNFKTRSLDAVEFVETRSANEKRVKRTTIPDKIAVVGKLFRFQVLQHDELHVTQYKVGYADGYIDNFICTAIWQE